MAITFLKMYNDGREIADKSGSPYFSQENFDIYATNKYNDWVEMMGKAIEQDERLMADILFLYKVFTKANSNEIDRIVDVPLFRRRLRSNTTYTACTIDPKTGKPEIKNPNIRWIPNSMIDEVQNDPYQRGTDKDPCGTATQLANGNVGWVVYTETVPLSLNMTFLKTPQNIDSQNNPTGLFEGWDYIAQYIIRAVVYSWDITIENYNRFKAEKGDLAEVLA